MNKELEVYKRKLKTQNITYVIAAVILASFIVLGGLKIIEPVAANYRWSDFWNGYISGVSFAVVGIMILGLVINLRALHDEKKLKSLYVKEHDERAIAINQRAGGLSYWFETIGLLMGTIIGGYFSITVSFVCLGCLLYICLVRLGLKIYFCNKI